MNKLSSKLGHFIVVAAIALCPILMTSKNAQAQCAVVGSIVTCGIDDNDGFASGVDITDLTIDEGVIVDDSAGDLGGTGIVIVNGDVTGTIVNNGIINDAIGGNDNALDVSGTLNALINNGTITSSGEHGVEAATLTSLINTGTITGGRDGARATTIIESLTNSGIITGGESGVFSQTITSLINSGLITGLGTYGVFAPTLGSLTNSGTITGNIIGVRATNIDSLINSGTITGILSIGVFADGDIISLINSGTITSESNFGVYVTNDIISLINYGTIIADNNGIQVDGAIRSLTNAGTITAGVGNLAIFEQGAGDTLLTLLPGSNIFGAIGLGGGVNTLVVGNGLSIDHNFLALPNIINSNGSLFAVDGNRVVVVDTTQLAQQDETLFDLSQGIWGTVFNNIGDGRNVAGSVFNGVSPQYTLGVVASENVPLRQTQTHMWASVFGNHRMQNGDGPAVSTHQDLYGFIGGIDGRVNSTLRLGGFLGFSETEINAAANRQEADVDSFFGGLYASLNGGTMVIDLGVTGGSTDHDSTRKVDNNQVNGLQTVSSSYDGTFIAPEISVSRQLAFAGMTLQPTLRAGYAGLFLDGFTETGSTAPLTVDDRDIHILHARFELALLMSSQGPDSFGINFSPYVGVKGRSLVDGEAVNATLLGQNLSFNPGGDEDIASAFVGMRMSVLKTENFGLFAGFEGSLDTEQSSTLSGGLGIKWQF